MTHTMQTDWVVAYGRPQLSLSDNGYDAHIGVQARISGMDGLPVTERKTPKHFTCKGSCITAGVFLKALTYIKIYEMLGLMRHI